MSVSLSRYKTKKRNKNIIIYIKINNNIYFYFLSFLIFFYLSNGKLITKLNKISEINLTIIGNGSQTILYNKYQTFYSESYIFDSEPSEILINGVKTNQLGFVVNNLINEENNITLRWNYSFNFCGMMFFNRYNITKIDLSNFDSSNCTNIICMFCHCISLESINLNNFNTSLVTNMNSLFYNCSSLLSLNLNNFDTTLVTNIYKMFYNCRTLRYLDLENFNTSLVVEMTALFHNCYSLTSINIRNFDTSLVTNMYCMFCNCESLEFLNLSHFNTSLVTNMRRMFLSCKSLTSLDISNFNTSLVTNMNSMFAYCFNLKSLNINHFDTSLLNTMISMFIQCTSLVSLDLSNFNTSLVTNMSMIFKNCKNLLSLELNNFNFSSVCDTTEMFYGCNNNLILCINNEYNSSTFNNYNFQNNCSYLCQLKSKIYIDENKNCIYNCFEDIEYKFEYNNKCYQSCPNGTNNLDDNYICQKEVYTSNSIEDNSIIKSNIVDNNIDSNTIVDNSFLDNISNNNNINIFVNMINFNNIFKKNNNISEDDIIKILRNELINNSLDSLINAFIEKEKKDLIYTKDKIIFQLTSSFNQKNNVYHNISSIDLGKCENLLRLYYNISDNITLLILKIDFYEDGLSIPIIEYDIYNSKTKEKLNLNICKDTKIKIYIPVSIDENNLFKYNSSHEYYNDICYPYTTEDKTDIILQDRREEYINKNLSLCEKNCEFKNFDFSNEKVECYCSVKNIFHSISDI